jgi:hypothetical protein
MPLRLEEYRFSPPPPRLQFAGVTHALTLTSSSLLCCLRRCAATPGSCGNRWCGSVILLKTCVHIQSFKFQVSSFKFKSSKFQVQRGLDI